MKQRQYIGQGKLFSLGFDKCGSKYVLETTEFDETHIPRRRVVAWVKLDNKGYVLNHWGVSTRDGEIVFQR